MNPLVSTVLAAASIVETPPPSTSDRPYNRTRFHRFPGETGVPTHKEIRERRKAERNRKRDARRKNRR